MHTTSLIAKEQLGLFRFAKLEVLKEDFQKVFRSFQLKKAEMLGNLYKSKVKIWFKTEGNEEKVVDTTVWSYTGEYVSIKGGQHIPVKAITNVEL